MREERIEITDSYELIDNLIVNYKTLMSKLWILNFKLNKASKSNLPIWNKQSLVIRKELIVNKGSYELIDNLMVDYKKLMSKHVKFESQISNWTKQANWICRFEINWAILSEKN